MRIGNQKGFTLIELMACISNLVIVLLLCGLVMGNFWVSDTTALVAVQERDPSMIKITDFNSRVWRYTRVTAEDKDGNQKKYYIDANVLQNRKAISVNKK